MARSSEKASPAVLRGGSRLIGIGTDRKTREAIGRNSQWWEEAGGDGEA